MIPSKHPTVTYILIPYKSFLPDCNYLVHQPQKTSSTAEEPHTKYNQSPLKNLAV